MSGGRWARESGQATVELLGALPAVLAGGLALFQLLALGHAAISAGTASEAAALALAGGGEPRAAAMAAMPGLDDDALDVDVSGGRVTVTVRPLSPIPGVSRALAVESSASVMAP